MTILIILLVIVAWFAWSFHTVLRQMGSIMSLDRPKDTWVTWIAMAPVLLILIVLDWGRTLEAKYRKK